jgi:hypothetical protein
MNKLSTNSCKNIHLFVNIEIGDTASFNELRPDKKKNIIEIFIHFSDGPFTISLK